MEAKMETDFYLPMIVVLLPITAFLQVIQVNPYHALVIRGVLGAVAALVDAVLGAADVALTEALVGTMLAITLYLVAVRSSLVLRLGITQDESAIKSGLEGLRQILRKWHLRLELVPYENPEALQKALWAKEVHGTVIYAQPSQPEQPLYHTQTRIQRIYDILTQELSQPEMALTYVNVSNSQEKP
jgi:putative multicomponent Na+:H+ antiporter subunit B